VLENEQEIIGFINSGATDDVQLSDEDFKDLIGHDANGRYIVIMSVVVHPDYQGKSMASVLMKHFIESMQDLGKEEIFLICQTELIGLYEKFDFVLMGKSNSDHGGLSWHDMSLTL
jgi:ribosomal protein S18 acetylase RimI-like enzyme